MYDCLLKPYRFCPPPPSATLQPSAAPLLAPSNIIDSFYGVPTANKAVVDRLDILHDMQAVLAQGSSSSECTILALRGLGGMGKTQLMLRYCYLHCAEYNVVIWLEFDSKAVAMDSFRKLANNLGFGEENAEKTVAFVRAWLQKQTGWLLLLDNVDDLETLELLPRIGGDIILTTREFIPSTLATTVPVGKMREEEALSLLVGRSSTATPGTTELSNAQQIVAELDFMALAVNLARAYIDDMLISFKDYLAMFKQGPNTLLSHRSSDKYQHTLKTVWQLSFERLRSQAPLAGQILDICAFLQPDAIPVGFFEHQFDALDLGSVSSTSPSSLEGDDLQNQTTVRAAIALLIRLSFLSRSSH